MSDPCRSNGAVCFAVHTSLIFASIFWNVGFVIGSSNLNQEFQIARLAIIGLHSTRRVETSWFCSRIFFSGPLGGFLVMMLVCTVFVFINLSLRICVVHQFTALNKYYFLSDMIQETAVTEIDMWESRMETYYVLFYMLQEPVVPGIDRKMCTR